MSYRLGVDLGTTFTAAAVANGQPPTMVGLGNRALQIPSVLFLAPDGQFLCGESAERRGLAEPDRVVREFKRRIGDSVPILVAGSPYSAQTLTARLLRHVWQTTRDRMGSEPGQVVLTHPANWGPYKLELLDQVASLADIGTVVRCPEPVAAAAQYAAQNRVEVGDTIAVYDLGGGTFDACVLRRTDDGFELAGTPEGIEHLGGIDFDEALFQHAMGLLGTRLDRLDPDDPEITVGLNRLRRDCVDAKEALSADTDAVLPVLLPGLSSTLRLTRSEFEGLIRPALQETVDAMGRTLRSAGVAPEQLSAIVLIGGSSRIPLVGELLQQRFGVPTALDTHPKHDVALGAVQTASTAVQTVRTSGPVRPSPPAPAPAPTPADRPDPAAASAPPATPVGGTLAGLAGPGPGAPGAAAHGPAAPGAAAHGPAAPGAAAHGPAAPGSTAPGPTAPGPTTPGTERPPAPSGIRRRVILIACVAAALVAGVVTGIVVVNRDSGRPNTAGGSGAESSAFDPSAAGQQLNGLPVSTPLLDTQLVVPVLTGRNWDLWLADTGEAAPVLRLTSDPAPDTTAAISPDRRTIIYTHDLDNEGTRTLLVKAAATPGDGRPLFDPMPPECAGTVFRPAWNPVDQNELAVPCVDANGRYGLYRFSTNGQLIASVSLPAGTGRVDDPSYSHDGKRLVFWAAPPSTWEGGTLYTVPVAGGQPTVLVPSTTRGEDADPVWAPDGKTIVFRRRVPDQTTGGNFEIFTVSTDGSARLHRLTHDDADEQDPIYSPDGTQIAYKSAATDPDRSYNAISRVWIMDADGKNQRPVWSAGADNSQTAPAWGRR